MRTSTTAAIAATLATGLAVAVLALWSPTATAGDGRETGRTEPAPVSVGSSGRVDKGSVPPAAPSASPTPAVEEPVTPPPAPVSRAPLQDPDAPVSSPALPYDPGYWTPERMASARPMPMPSPG